MNNAEKFKSVFGIYATELWAMPEKDFLEWINAEMNIKDETYPKIKAETRLSAEQPQPEIIRCKDCVKAKDYGYGILWCERLLGTFRVNPDDFCSYGERREE